mgnify:CR=1 FL=1
MYSTPGSIGSSPRGRGKPRCEQLWHFLHGLIPARAGKTPTASSPRSWRPAHPRAGGENTTTRRRTGRTPGSSPRGRGKREVDGGEPWLMRLIPARAGKTEMWYTGDPHQGAHPRAGGENAELGFQKVGGSGSSPRGRGKRANDVFHLVKSRLIPARAGKTPCQGRNR